MKIPVHKASEITPGEFGPVVAAMGNFDGVHRAHREICDRTVARARELGVPPIVYTFRPHPRRVLQGPEAVQELTTFEKRCELLGRAGIEVVVWSEFTREFSNLSPEEFVHHLLMEKLGIRAIYVGHDARFARNREGNYETLVREGKKHGFEAHQVDTIRIEDIEVSSSKIRELILGGDLRKANRLLGWTYTIEGKVVRGAGRGKQLGFPTANVESPNEVLPAIGIYATWTRVDDQWHPSATNVGRSPTFTEGEAPIRIEPYLIDFSGDLYGKKLEVAFVERIRGEEKFPGPEALRKRIIQDVERARKILADEEKPA